MNYPLTVVKTEGPSSTGFSTLEQCLLDGQERKITATLDLWTYDRETNVLTLKLKSEAREDASRLIAAGTYAQREATVFEYLDNNTNKTITAVLSGSFGVNKEELNVCGLKELHLPEQGGKLNILAKYQKKE